MNSSRNTPYQTDKMVIRDQVMPSNRDFHEEHLPKSNKYAKFYMETSLKISQIEKSNMLNSKVGLNRKPLFTVSDKLFHNILDPKTTFKDFHLVGHDRRISYGSHAFGSLINEQSPKNKRNLQVHFASDLDFNGNDSKVVQEKITTTCQKNSSTNYNYLKYNASSVRKRKYQRRNSATAAMLLHGMKKIKSSD